MSTDKALIFAAGLGTRLRPLTDSLPKALVPIAGKPLLAHVADKLMDSGFTDLTVNVHHFPEQIIRFLEKHYPTAHVSDESDCLLETGGGIRRAEAFLQGAPFLVHNVDILSNLDLLALQRAARPEALATLVVSERSTQRYFLFDDELRLRGWTHLGTGEVRSPFGPIDPARYHKLAFSGIHYIAPEIFAAFRRVMGTEQRFPIVDFYLAACRDYPIYGYVPADFRMVDVGKFDSLAQAEATAREWL